MKVPWQKERSTGGETAVQLRSGGRSTFGRLESYVPLLDGETALYREVREAVPVVDAAICKLIRLTGGVRVACGNERAEQGLQRFLCEVPVGRGQRGINAFWTVTSDSLLTCGRAVGEIVPDAEGREIAAVLCADVSQVEVREGTIRSNSACAVWMAAGAASARVSDLLLFTPLNPEAGHPYGVSMLRSMPYLTGLLLKIYDAMGKNWDRCGNVRFAVTYKPQDGELDRGAAQERAEQIAEEMVAGDAVRRRNGSVRDFVSVGDVSIKAIGADNQILDSETPVRQILEQLVAKTGLPPFMLGLSWSSTERMSAQQADMLTSEITALRRTLEPVIERVCTLWLRMHGYGCRAVVDWEDINLQDEVEEAKAALYLQQARKLRQENDEAEGK
ncbi:MAG: serine/threonine protein phosphatase [Oscillibacter sp.]